METSKKTNLTILPSDLLTFTIATVGISKAKRDQFFASASNYLKGLMQATRKNMERMEEHVVGADDQALQYMLTEAQWDSQAVMDQVAQEVNQLLGGDKSCLLLDESGVEKKGENSVGVARQWNGRLGKVDNCQVGVFAALGRGARATLIDYRLYLPKSWSEDEARCQKNGDSRIMSSIQNQIGTSLGNGQIPTPTGHQVCVGGCRWRLWKRTGLSAWIG
jgi:FOG: Transposase